MTAAGRWTENLSPDVFTFCCCYALPGLTSALPLWLMSLPWEAQARLCSVLTSCLLLCSAWADHFDAAGVDYVFWSAKTAIDGLAGPAQSVAGHVERDERARVVSIDQLSAVFEARAQAAVEARLGRDEAADSAVQVRQEIAVGCTPQSAVGGISCCASALCETCAGRGQQLHCAGAQVAGALQLPGCAVKICWELLRWGCGGPYPSGTLGRGSLSTRSWMVRLCNRFWARCPGLKSRRLLGTGPP